MKRLILSLFTYFLSLFIFAQSSNISGYEYWFDDNYTNKVSQSTVSAPTLNLSLSLNVDALSTGYHTLNIRVKDEYNSWSVVKSSYFIKLGRSGAGEVITGYRYWFDNGRDTTEVNVPIATPASIVSIANDVNTLGLDTGYHWIYIQVKDTAKVWSSVLNKRFRTIGEPRIDYITPNKGGNIGDVTINVYGRGFFEGTTVKLARGNDTIYIADSVTSNNGLHLTAIADLRQAAPGDYDVIATVPGDTVMKLVNAFKIIEGVYADVFTDINGPSNLRIGTWGKYSVRCGNNGNVNATGVLVWIAIPQNVDFKFNFSPYYPANTMINWDSIPIAFNVDTVFGETMGYKIIPLFVSSVGPNSSTSVDIMLKQSSTERFNIKAWSYNPLYQSPLNPAQATCIANIANSLVEAGGDLAVKVFAPEAICFYGGMKAGLKTYMECRENDCNKNPAFWGWLLADFLEGCVTEFVPNSKFAYTVEEIVKNIAKGKKAFDGLENVKDCIKAFLPPNPPKDLPIIPVRAMDPNEKYGPTSFDTSKNKYITKTSPFNYSIHFENDSAATAAAQAITIVDTLDKSVFNFSTFKLGSVTIGDTIINIPQGVKSYFTEIDLTKIGTYYVCRINAGLNELTGVATWTFETLEPSTFQLTTDALAGVLPPNVQSPKGQASVNFSVETYDTVSLNTAIDNRAQIYFDNNLPITTNTWHNKIDNIKPSSYVHLLPPKSDSVFTIDWTGFDVPSGLFTYNIYYSINGDPFILLLNNTTNTSFQYHGLIDSTYSFYSIATDKAGNREAAKINADATTLVAFQKSDSICIGGDILFPSAKTKVGNIYQWQINTGTGYNNVVNNTVYSGANKDTLSLKGVPTSNYGNSYRCIIKNGSSTDTSVEYILKFKNLWKGTSNTSWHNPLNWECGAVPDENTDVIIKEGTLFKPVISQPASCRSLTIRNSLFLTVNSTLNIKGKK